MTNVHIHVPEAPFWDRDIYGSAMHNGVPVFSKLGRGPRGYKGEKGDKGDRGPGAEDGFSPWVEFEYPEDPETGHTVLIVHDRYGEHRLPLDPKPDPAQMDDDDLLLLSAKLRNPGTTGISGQWIDFTSNSDLNMTNVSGNRTKIPASNFIVAVNPSIIFPYFLNDGNQYYVHLANNNSYLGLPAGDYVLSEIEFSRNGLEYARRRQHVMGPFFDFSFEADQSDPDRYNAFVFLSPQIEVGHSFGEGILSVRFVPYVPQENGD